MFRNEKELLKSLHNATNGFPNCDFGNNIFSLNNVNALTSEELNELEKYRDKDGLLNFTKVKDFNKLANLIEMVERKNILEETVNGIMSNMTADDYKNLDMKDYITGLIDEFIPLVGLREANICVETPEGKTEINIEGGDNPKISYVTTDADGQVADGYETGFDKGSPEGDYTCTTTIGITPEKEEKVILDEPVVEEVNETPILDVYEDCECEEYPVVKLFECGGVHNPKYYHAVMHICEVEHFPETAGVYGYDEYAPAHCDIAVILPNVWGKITAAEVDFFLDMMGNNTEVFVIDPETFELYKIEDESNLFLYEMTPQQEEVFCNHE